MTIQHITKGSVLNDLGLSRAETSNLKIRAELMSVIEKFIHHRQLKQVYRVLTTFVRKSSVRL